MDDTVINRLPAATDTVAAVLLLRADGAALLQHRDNKPGLRHANMWVPPGGHCDAGESPIDCARREFLEETCYLCRDLHLLTVIDVPPEHGCKAMWLHVFWAAHDGYQRHACREGQALEFIPRGQAMECLLPGFVVAIWDQALAALAKHQQPVAG